MRACAAHHSHVSRLRVTPSEESRQRPPAGPCTEKAPATVELTKERHRKLPKAVLRESLHAGLCGAAGIATCPSASFSATEPFSDKLRSSAGAHQDALPLEHGCQLATALGLGLLLLCQGGEAVHHLGTALPQVRLTIRLNTTERPSQSRELILRRSRVHGCEVLPPSPVRSCTAGSSWETSSPETSLGIQNQAHAPVMWWTSLRLRVSRGMTHPQSDDLEHVGVCSAALIVSAKAEEVAQVGSIVLPEQEDILHRHQRHLSLADWTPTHACVGNQSPHHMQRAHVPSLTQEFESSVSRLQKTQLK